MTKIKNGSFHSKVKNLLSSGVTLVIVTLLAGAFAVNNLDFVQDLLPGVAAEGDYQNALNLADNMRAEKTSDMQALRVSFCEPYIVSATMGAKIPILTRVVEYKEFVSDLSRQTVMYLPNGDIYYRGERDITEYVQASDTLGISGYLYWIAQTSSLETHPKCIATDVSQPR